MTGRRPVGRSPGWHFPSREGIKIHFMAQRIQTLLIDDLDGGEAAGTVRFGLDGAEYEIDLSAAHDEELRKALQRYLAHARRTGGTARSAARGRAAAPPSTPPRSASGPRGRASRSRTAAASRPTSSSSTRRPQEHNRLKHPVAGPQAAAAAQCGGNRDVGLRPVVAGMQAGSRRAVTTPASAVRVSRSPQRQPSALNHGPGRRSDPAASIRPNP